MKTLSFILLLSFTLLGCEFYEPKPQKKKVNITIVTVRPAINGYLLPTESTINIYRVDGKEVNLFIDHYPPKDGTIPVVNSNPVQLIKSVIRKEQVSTLHVKGYPPGEYIIHVWWGGHGGANPEQSFFRIKLGAGQQLFTRYTYQREQQDQTIERQEWQPWGTDVKLF